MVTLTRNPLLFTGEEKTFLEANECIRNGEYLFSPEGTWRLGLWGKKETHSSKGLLFIFNIDPDNPKKFNNVWQAAFPAHDDIFGIMQGDGNFCVYEGTGLDNKGKLLWNTGTKQEQQVKWIANMQHDGNFCIYNGDYTAHTGTIIWQAGFNQGIPDHYEFKDIVYDYGKKSMLNPVIETAFTQTLKNDSSEAQKSEIKFSITQKSSWSWQTKSSSTLTVKSSVKIPLADIATLGFEISGSFTEESARGSENATERKEEYTVPVAVPAHSTVKVEAVITKQTIKVPYIAKGVFYMKDSPGKKYTYCELEGIFTAKSGSSLDIYYQEIKMSTAPQAETTVGEVPGIGKVTAVTQESIVPTEAVGKRVKLDQQLITKL